MDFDLSVLSAVVGGAATSLLTRFLGITQRLQSLERRVDTQAEVIANQAQQIAGLTAENREQAKKLAKQDAIIGKQARLIGDLTRANRQLSTELRRKDKDNAALAAEMADLRVIIRGSRDKPSGLPADLYEPLPPPPKLPKL